MTSNMKDTHVELRLVRDLVTSLGRSHLLYLVALIADEQRDVALANGEIAHAYRHAHDAKVLGEVAIRLLD